MDSNHIRPSTAPHGGRPPAYAISPSSVGRLPQAIETSRYQRLRGKSISSENGQEIQRPTYHPPDLSPASISPSKRLLRIGGWLRGRVQQSQTKASHSASSDPAELGSPASRNNRWNAPNEVSTTRSASPPTKPLYCDYPRSQESAARGGSVTRRGNASIADEVALPEVESENILDSQSSSISTISVVQEPHRVASAKHTRPIFNKLTSLTGAVGMNSTRHQAHEMTSEGKKPAAGNLGAAEGETSPTKIERHCSKSTVETQRGNDSKLVVAIHFSGNIFHVAVAPDTWPRDIASATARLFPEMVEPAECVIVECCKDEGVQRCLRQYERIRDVMSTWGPDRDNLFIVLPCSPIQTLDHLKLASVLHLENPPPGFAFQLYHSTQPGNWNRSWVTLAETGLIFATNQPASQPLSRNTISLCHLSEYDIYNASKKMEKQFQIPTRYCFVLRKQISREVIPKDGDPIHLFSSDIQQLAERFFELIQRWRSWYLVHGKGRYAFGGKATLPPPSPLSKHQDPLRLIPPPQTGTPGLKAEPSDKLAQWGLFPGLKQPRKPSGESRVEAGEPPNHKAKPIKSRATAGSRERSPSVRNQPNISVSEEDYQHISGSTASRQEATTLPGQPSNLLEASRESQPLSPTSLPEKKEEKEIQSWFPSAVEHSARTRYSSGKRSIYRPRTAYNLPNGKPKNPKSYRSADNGNRRKQVVRPEQIEQDADLVAHFAQRPPPYGRVPRQAGRGKRSYQQSPNGQILNLPGPGQPVLDQKYVPPVPDRSPKRVGQGTQRYRGHGLSDKVE